MRFDADLNVVNGGIAMPLHQIRDFDPDYRRHFDDRDVLKFDVHSGSEKVGSVDDLLVDDGGQFRYLVINTGAWIVGKKVLVPISRSRIDDGSQRVYVDGLTRDQVKNLPEYKGDPVDYDYEERVRGVYRPMVATRGTAPGAATYDRNSYRYDRDPGLYNLNDREHESWRRSEARMVSGKPIAGRHRRSVGVFPNRAAAEQAMHELRDSGFPMGRVSIITRDADKHDNEIAGAEVRDRVGNKADEGATIGAVSGGVLGGLTGLLVGLGTLAIPGVGPIMLAGATATTLATTLAGGAIGAVSGGLLGALVGLGIPEERARVYEDRIARGGYLVIVDGTDKDIARAEAILHRRGIEDYGVYDAPAATAAIPVSTMPATGTTPVGRRSAVGFFPNLANVEHAVTDLRSIGFPLHQISLVAHNFRRRDQFTGIDLRDRFEAARLGIPTEEARFYDDRLGRGEHMVIVQGTEDELNRAAPILNRRGIEDWRVYDPTVVDHELPVEVPRRSVATPVASGSTVSSVHHPQSAVGFFSQRHDAEQAIADLRAAGFPLGQVSLVAQRFEQRQAFTGVDLRDRFDNSRFGFPEERARFFNNRIARGDYLVVVHGTPEQLRQAETILKRARVDDFGLYDAQASSHEQPDYQLINRTSVPTPATPIATSTTTPIATSTTTPVTTSSGTNRIGMQRKRAIGVFSHRREAEAALTELRHAGFPMDRVSLIAKHAGDHDRVAGVDMQSRTDNKADEGAKAGAATGGALGGLGGLLVGLGTLAIPGLGPVMLGGAAATALATALAGGAIGAAAGGLTGALVGLGIPEDRARVYNDRVARGDYLVMIDGTEAETRQAEAVLQRHNIQEWNLFDTADVDETRHSHGSVDRLAPDADPIHRDRDPRIEQPQPNVTIVDRRDETRL
jgi:hypothetical protein